MSNTHSLEIFCGTGGVGKTTLATSRALYWAQKKQKVLLITIDPSLRLKQLLGLDPQQAGDTQTIWWPDGEFEKDFFYAELMSPEKTLKRMMGKEDTQSFNRILKILSRPHGGLYEILGVLEIEAQMKSQKFDRIIVDTAPGEHFIDFLENGKKFKDFFEQHFVEVFLSVKNRVTKGSFGASGILNHLVQGGIKKLLDYLERITGKQFVNEFIETVELIYSLKNGFMRALDFEKEYLFNDQHSLWFLVTAADHDKARDAIKLKEKVPDWFWSNSVAAINKCQARHWKEAETDDTEGLTEETRETLKNLSHSFTFKEEKIGHFMLQYFPKVIFFNEVLDHSPQVQLGALAREWSQYGICSPE